MTIRSSLMPRQLTLFATLKLADDNSAYELPNHPIVQKWWACAGNELLIT